MNDRLWSIILAGGDGERLTPLIERWLGRHIPKQYCTFLGTRSMLQHTLDRADHLSIPDHRVTVIAREHRRMALQQFQSRRTGVLIEEPANRGTAARILLALAFVNAHDPSATVVIYPGDHFVFPSNTFLEAVQSAVAAAEQLPEKMILLGTRPHGLELDYGWISRGAQLASPFEGVEAITRFDEKPELARAISAMISGALWNTSVLATKAHLLWQLCWRYIPEIIEPFEWLIDAIDTPDEQPVLESVYQQLPARNFASAVLERAIDHLAVIEMKDVLWSDWDTPERIVDSLFSIGQEPRFPVDWLQAHYEVAATAV